MYNGHRWTRLRLSNGKPVQDCAQSAERLGTRIAALMHSVTQDSLSCCADLAADVLESEDFAELVRTKQLPADHIEALLWAEEVLHQAEAHLDARLPLNNGLADSLNCRLSKVHDWLRRLTRDQGSPGNNRPGQTSHWFPSTGLSSLDG